MNTKSDSTEKVINTVYSLAPISLMDTGFEPHGFDLYISGSEGARDAALLREHNIAIVINCAVNMDINYVTDPIDPAEGEKCAQGVGPARIYKLGLVDGPGNTENMMLASYYILDGAIRQVLPEKPTYPRREQGNVLVHCRGGRSRSTALAALYMHLHRPEKYPTMEDALTQVRTARGLHPDEWYQAPKQMLVDQAVHAAEIVRMINARKTL
ncbi:MAG: dual specificity protein phosphatase family protein [Rhodospirillales bacterium]|nr:dual specificity protein phosphatase family protein [Rhodospirillales bacterium]